MKELPTPQEIPSYADDTPYEELANQPFLNVAAAPTDDFTYEKAADGIRHTSTVHRPTAAPAWVLTALPW